MYTRIPSVLALATAILCAACGADPEPDPTPDAMTEADADTECVDLCAVEDTDLGNLPSNRCPGALEEACVAQCQARMPAGDWCAAP